MPHKLTVSLGQHSDKGRKSVNQDFHGACIPKEPQLTSKGIAIALADGISSSDVSQIASETTVTAFFEDYFSTSETWSVKKSAQRVLMATNSWLHSQTRRSEYRYDKDRGYVCTFSAMVIKSNTAHIFHVGDSRIYRVRGNALEQLTNDHRLQVSREQSYLSQAMGINPHLEIDYQSLPLDPGDTFILMTDGVYEYTDHHFITDAIRNHTADLDAAARMIVAEAHRLGSTDNLTAQIIRLDELPQHDTGEMYRKLTALPFPPVLEARMVFDGYRILRQLHASSRSHVYLAEDMHSRSTVTIKVLSTELQQDPEHLERFLMEEWIARRMNSPYVVKPCAQDRSRNYLYTVMEYIDGQTLAQWMTDHPKADLETVRGIAEQIAKGLQAFHRLEMLHQDIRPGNIIIDTTGTVKIIDFGSTSVAGLNEVGPSAGRNQLLGTVQYTAPEYFLGESGTASADLFSLGVITYQMLTGKLPYGTQVPKARTAADQKKLVYRSAFQENRALPPWVDEVLRKALHPNPYKRYESLSEFTFELRNPQKHHLNRSRQPLMERDPVLFWKSCSFVLTVTIIILLVLHY